MGNNPIKFNDPLGDTLSLPGASDQFKMTFQKTYYAMSEKRAAGKLFALLGSSENVNLVESTGTELSHYDPKTKTIHWNPKLGFVTTKDVALSPASFLNHEVDHALQHVENKKQSDKDTRAPDWNYTNKEEKRVITGSEKTTAYLLGEVKEGQKTRTNHKGKVIFITNDPMSNKGTIVQPEDANKKPPVKSNK
jgi:hypothetical protein